MLSNATQPGLKDQGSARFNNRTGSCRLETWEGRCAALELGQSDLENEGKEENVLTFKTILLSCLVQYSTFCLNEAFVMRLPWVAAKSRQCSTAFFCSLSLSVESMQTDHPATLCDLGEFSSITPTKEPPFSTSRAAFYYGLRAKSLERFAEYLI